MKHPISWLATALLLLASCGNQEDILPSVGPIKKTQEENQNLSGPKIDQVYKIQTGTITFEGWEGDKDTITGRWTAVVQFDDYGRKERKDTYHGDGTLAGIVLNDGKKTYLLDPVQKIAHHQMNIHEVGTETRFDWAIQNKVGQSYEPVMEIIAGKECALYSVPMEGGIVTYAGFANIMFLLEYTSEVWGNYSSRAIEFDAGPIAAERFAIPKDYAVVSD